MQWLYWISLIILSPIIAIGSAFGLDHIGLEPDWGLYVGETFFSAGLVAWPWLFLKKYRKRISLLALAVGGAITLGSAFGGPGFVPCLMFFGLIIMCIVPNKAPLSDVVTR